MIALILITVIALDAVSEDESLAQLIMSGVMLAMVAFATVLVTLLQARSRRTEHAVHTADGTSVSEQLTRMEGRVAANETRMTNQAIRIDQTEKSVAVAHRRVDEVAGDLTRIAATHGGRLTAAETAIAELQNQEAS